MTRTYELIPRADRFMSLLPGMDMFDLFFDDFGLTDLFNREDTLVPAFDIFENDKAYVITGEIPGVDAKDLDVTLTDDILTIKGEKRQESENKDENYYRIERRYGSFERTFEIPKNVKTDNLDATYKDGVFKLSLPKAEVVEAKKIEVKENKAKKKNKPKK
ncbi:MAG: Hsp20/alpha crystallin family protein [Deltaproteobacteria bacterium]|nr:Hsp20/alpha crystallin family protein [Deltaproteobacteria bacterium]